MIGDCLLYQRKGQAIQEHVINVSVLCHRCPYSRQIPDLSKSSSDRNHEARSCTRSAKETSTRLALLFQQVTLPRSYITILMRELLIFNVEESFSNVVDQLLNEPQDHWICLAGLRLRLTQIKLNLIWSTERLELRLFFLIRSATTSNQLLFNIYTIW